MPVLRRLESNNTMMAVAVGLPAVIVVVGVIVCCVCLCRRQETTKSTDPNGNVETDTYAAISPHTDRSTAQQRQHDKAAPRLQEPRQSQRGHNSGGKDPYWLLKTISSASDASNESFVRTTVISDEALAEMQIPHDEIQKGPLISRGGFGEVYLGYYHDMSVAIKQLLPHLTEDEKCVKAFLAEAKVCVALCHANIVPLIGITWGDGDNLCVVTEFMSGGDLRSLIDDYSKAKVPMGFDNLEKLKIAWNIASALQYLHLSCIIHRDLKSRNVLLNDKRDAKITDFGIARLCTEETMTAGVGTSRWIAPEVMKGEKYNDKADMYSFGAVLAEIDNYLIPYGHADRSSDGKKLAEFTMIQRILEGDVAIEFTTCASRCPEVVTVYNLARACVSLNPRTRPSAKDAAIVLERAVRAVRIQETSHHTR